MSICQNLGFRTFFFAVEPLMIASLTFPEVLVQQVSLFISSPFFSVIAPGCRLYSSGFTFVTKETPMSSKTGVHLPSRSSILKQSCMDFLQEQQFCPSLSPPDSLPQGLLLQAKCHSTHRRMTLRKKFVSFLNEASQVILSAAKEIYWFLHMDHSVLYFLATVY